MKFLLKSFIFTIFIESKKNDPALMTESFEFQLEYRWLNALVGYVNRHGFLRQRVAAVFRQHRSIKIWIDIVRACQ